MNVRLGAAIAVSLAVLMAAPIVGQIRGAIQDALPGQYRVILMAVVVLAVGGGVVYAALRIRSRRFLRYGLIALAVAAGAAYAAMTATGNANVDAVERFHFVEYGLLTLLYHRAWRDAGGLSSIFLPFMAVFMVGTLDETIQWFVPARVGEWRDVLLNAVAIACGLVFASGLDGPVRLKADTTYGADRRLAVMALLTVALFGAFFYIVHIGHEIHDPAIGSFRSRFHSDELLALADDRARRWRAEPPLTLHRFSREDQYLAEALWHIQRRNEVEGEASLWRAWKENLILEKYFAPVLEFPTYATPEGARWPPQQRDHAEAAAAGIERAFVSDAHPFPIYAWLHR